jgi:hypothetical protein
VNPSPLPYLLDTSVFIEAHQRYYGFDIAPGFWEALLRYAQQGYLLSIDRVSDELLRQQDELAKWVTKHFAGYFLSTKKDESILDAYQAVINWAVSEKRYTQAAKREFAEATNADAWIVAYARAKGCRVVT